MKQEIKRGAVDVRKRILHPAFRSAEVVTVNAVPMTRRERSYDPIIDRVYRLPRGQGLRCPCGGVDRKIAEARQVQLGMTGRRMGKPVVTRLRSMDKFGYVIFVFKRSDLTKTRTGKETR